MTEAEIILGRHDVRLSNLERDVCKLEKALSKIYISLVGIAGGIIVSLVLLVVNLSIGR